MMVPQSLLMPRFGSRCSSIGSSQSTHLGVWTSCSPGPCLAARLQARAINSQASSSTNTTSTSSTSQATTAAADPSTSTSSSTSEPADSCTVSYRGAVFSVPRGTKLRTALLQQGVSPHNGRAQLINCRGLGTCGTCAVEIRGKVLPEQWCTAEQLRLNFPPHKAPNNQRLRLACQVSCEGPQLEVVKRDRFWGQGDTVLGPAGPGEYSTPLGELEYVLDGNRQQQRQQQQGRQQ